jgi:uncharacterized surface protein with fasciclin (FAS1) repeats
MNGIISRSIGLIGVIFSLQFSQTDAYCPRCAKIEEERAEEQSKNPQPNPYYDPASSSLKSGTDGQPAPPKKEQEKSLQLNLASALAKNENSSIKKISSVNSGSENPNYSSFYTLFKTKDFLETLDGPFTLFIPTNEAILKLPPDFLANLTKPENKEKLAAIVSNHLVAKKFLKKDLIEQSNKEIKAISGRNLRIRSDQGKISIDNAKIIEIEPAGYDGVIYIIDQVLQ